MIFRRMIAHVLACAWIAFISATALAADKAAPATSKSLATHSTSQRYPEAPRADVVDDYHGTRVGDPYRPLEDPDSEATRAWVEAENKITFGFLETIAARGPLKDRLTRLWDFEKFTVPFTEGGRYFYMRNSGLQNQNVLYTVETLDGTPRVLLDPNTLSADGTVALAAAAVSDDGTKLAYALADAGSDWITWKVRDVLTGKDTDDLVRWSKFSGASWTKDGKGFFYGRYPEPQPGEDLRASNYFQKLYYHALGTPQSDDRLIYERPDHKEWKFASAVTDDGQYLVIEVTKSTDDRNQVLYKRLDQPDSPIVELIDNFEAGYELIDNDGPVLFFKTNNAAPRGRVVAIDTRQPDAAHWKELIPQSAETLRVATLVGDRFFANYLKDAHTQVKVFDIAGQPLSEVQFPGLGTVAGFDGKRHDKETFYSYASFATPTTIYRYTIADGKSSLYRAPKVGFKPEDFATEQVFFPSKDGTKIPMFISYKKGLKRDGHTPTFLYGYGGFNIALTPTFSVTNIVWMELGGIFAMPNLRGGGEYGEDWHKAGTQLQKQNVFDDFIAAAEWLIANKYTSTPRLAIGGGSNGGLLVGACLTQRPTLFGAALPAVGVLDMLRFHKFTIGHAWVDDYGSSDDPQQFKALLKYSPLHAIRPGTCYPPTLITTADHDDRVVPAHSFKFAATMQAAQSCDNPILIRIETKAGHGAGKPTTKIIEEAADKWAFLVKVLHVDVPSTSPTSADAGPRGYKPPDDIDCRPATIVSEGVRLAADVFVAKANRNRRLPTIIMSHGWGGQASLLRPEAVAFARAGYLVVTFDYRGWGASESRVILTSPAPADKANNRFTAEVQEIREVVDPQDQIVDLLNAIHWTVGEPQCDTDRIALWGSSYSGGHVVAAAARDPRVKALVSQVPGMDSRFVVATPAEREATYREATARARGEIGYPPPGAKVLGNLKGAPIRPKLANYAPVDDADKAPNCAMLFIVAENEELFDNRQHGVLAYQRAKGPKRLVTLPNITHYGVYLEAHGEALKQAMAWFDENLKK